MNRAYIAEQKTFTALFLKIKNTTFQSASFINLLSPMYCMFPLRAKVEKNSVKRSFSLERSRNKRNSCLAVQDFKMSNSRFSKEEKVEKMRKT